MDILDGTNYPCWKARMKVFIKAIDQKAWRSVLTGWEHPTIKEDEGKVILKAEESRSSEEDRLANNNAKALNAIYTAVDANQFKLISTCETAKEAWSILETAHEPTAAVRTSKLLILATRFEELRMREDEMIADFNAKLCDIANQAFALGEKYSDTKLVRKTLRSLPERFAIKVTAIEEAKDVDSVRLDELMGSLQTFEMKFKQNQKEKGIALQAETQAVDDTGQYDNDLRHRIISPAHKRFQQNLEETEKEKSKRSSMIPTKV